MRHFCLYLTIRLIFTCPSGLYFWVYLPTRLIFLRLTAHQVNFLPAHQVNLSKFTWPVPIRLIFLSLPAHQVVSICKDDTGETLLNSVHTVSPEVITVGVIDFHLRRRESSLYKSLFSGDSPRHVVAPSSPFPQPTEALSPPLSPPSPQVRPSAPQASLAAFSQTAPAARAQSKIVEGLITKNLVIGLPTLFGFC